MSGLSSTWGVLAAFLAGALYGREAKARRVAAPPRIVYYPVSRRELSRELPLEEVKRVVASVVREGLGASVSEEEISRVAERVRELMDLVRRRDLYVKMLEDASRAFIERRISRDAYVLLARRYQRKLVEVERELARVGL